MAETSHLRISDHDRDQAAAAIREHFAAGRLESDEIEERIQAVYAARTRRELDLLTADLPSLPMSAAEVRTVAAQRAQSAGDAGCRRQLRAVFDLHGHLGGDRRELSLLARLPADCPGRDVGAGGLGALRAGARPRGR
jgi:hypothetical protein